MKKTMNHHSYLYEDLCEQRRNQRADRFGKVIAVSLFVVVAVGINVLIIKNVMQFLWPI